jgi:SAM-dependent methyltransferase
MRIGTIAESFAERVTLATGILPTPLVDTLLALLLARTVMVATRVGVFDALADRALDADAVAARCGTHPEATVKLLDALVGARYLRASGGRYALSRSARKWLVGTSPFSLRDSTLFTFVEWALLERYDDYLRSGQPVQVHEELSPAEWGAYQRGFRSRASLSAPEIAWRTPVPRGARHLLDLGGGHGYYSVALCRRHRRLHATVIDLPAAVREAEPILAREAMAERVVQRAADLRSVDLGESTADVVFAANLVHHFDAEQNRDLARRAARALRPGGTMVVVELIRPSSLGAPGQAAALADLYFAATSRSGTWSFEEIARWQRDAGLEPKAPIRLVTAPGGGMQVGVKPKRRASRPCDG